MALPPSPPSFAGVVSSFCFISSHAPSPSTSLSRRIISIARSVDISSSTSPMSPMNSHTRALRRAVSFAENSYACCTAGCSSSLLWANVAKACCTPHSASFTPSISTTLLPANGARAPPPLPPPARRTTAAAHIEAAARPAAPRPHRRRRCTSRSSAAAAKTGISCKNSHERHTVRLRDCRKPLQKVMLCSARASPAASRTTRCALHETVYAPSSHLVHETGKHSENTRTKNLEKQTTTVNVLRCAVRVSATLTVRAPSRSM